MDGWQNKMYKGWTFVDVDGTLIDIDDNPRPEIRELFITIKNLDLILVVWSGGGKEYAEKVIKDISFRLGWDLRNFVDNFMWKGTPIQWSHIKPVWFVDDSKHIKQEHSTDGERVFLVPFYNSITAANDTWLIKAREDVQQFMEKYREISIDSIV